MTEENRMVVKKRKRICVIESDEDESTPTPSSTNSTEENIISDLAGMVKNLVKTVELQASGRRSTRAEETSFTVNVIPVFNPEDQGQSIDRWCDRIEELRSLYGWSDERTIYNALTKLEGLAKIWYRSLPTINFSWEEWKLKLKIAFPSRRDFCHCLREMMQRTKQRNESYITYYYEKEALLNQCKIVGVDAVSCMIDGISDPMVQAAARAKDCVTCEALLNFLRTCEMSTPGTSGVSQVTYRNNKLSGKNNKNLQQRTFFKAKEQITCFKCQNKGHRASECRKSIKCYNCQGFGHQAKFCTSRKSQKNQRTNTTTENVL